MLFFLASAGTAQAPPASVAIDTIIPGQRHELAPIGWVLGVPDGELWVSQHQDRRILRFDRDGSPIGPIGRAGEGPGEFRSLAWGGLAGGTVWVHDGLLQRLTRFPLGGGAPRTTRVPGYVRNTDGTTGPAIVRVVAVRDDGAMTAELFLNRVRPRPAWAIGDPAEVSPIVTLDSEGAVTRLLGWAPTDECSVPIRIAGAPFSTFPVPLCPRGMHDASPTGAFLVEIRVPEWRHPSAEVTLELRRADGERVYRSTRMLPRRAVSRTTADSIRRVEGRRARSPHVAEAYRRVPIPERYPALSAALVGDDGTVWLGRWPEAGQRDWMVLDARGTPSHTVRLPEAVTLHQVSRTWALGTTRDHDGIESVVKIRIT